MSRENDYFRKVAKILSLIASIGTLYVSIINLNFGAGIFTLYNVLTALAYISVAGCLTFSFIKYKLIPYLSFLALNIALVYCLSQYNLILLFVIPALLLYYLSNKRAMFQMLIFTAVLFACARVLRPYLLLKYIGNIYVLLGLTIKACIESIIAICIFFLIYNLTTKANQQEIFSNKTNINLLKFYYATTAHHSKYHQAHIKGVKEITSVLLESLVNDFGLKISKDFYDQIIFSSQFYDIGKVCIDPEILDKTDTLTDEEKELIKQHPQKGAELLSLLPKEIIKEEYLNTCKNVALQHHEKLDGSGYPNHLKQEEISLEARIITVADVTDALLAWRPYKRPYSWEELLEIFKNEATGYDSLILQALYKNRRKIISISDENNQLLKEVLSLDSKDILRK